MPSNLMLSDSSFPHFTGSESTEDKVQTIQNYLYMLLEQLRYSLGNISRDNINDADFAEISGLINEPVYVVLRDIDGKYAEIVADYDGLAARVGNAEGSITSLTLTAEGLNTRVQSAEGTLTTLSATLGGLTLDVTNGDSTSTIKLMSNGVQIGSTGTIGFTGMVTFNSLAGSGMSVINGDNITTGTISAITVAGCKLDCYLADLSVTNMESDGQLRFFVGNRVTKQLVGGIRFDTAGGTEFESWNRLFLYTKKYDLGDETYTYIPLKFDAEGGMSFRADLDIYMQCEGKISLTCNSNEGVRIANLRAYTYAWSDDYWEFKSDGIYYGGVKKVSV